MIDLSEEERDYLIELLEASHKQMLHELHHTDTASFEGRLKEQIALNEGLQSKLRHS